MTALPMDDLAFEKPSWGQYLVYFPRFLIPSDPGTSPTGILAGPGEAHPETELLNLHLTGVLQTPRFYHNLNILT